MRTPTLSFPANADGPDLHGHRGGHQRDRSRGDALIHFARGLVAAILLGQEHPAEADRHIGEDYATIK